MRSLKDLISVGSATLKDFELLEIKSIEELAQQNHENLYLRLCKLTGARQDICVKDVFQAAIEQAKNPNLPKEKCQWYYWSRKRKS